MVRGERNPYITKHRLRRPPTRRRKWVDIEKKVTTGVEGHAFPPDIIIRREISVTKKKLPRRFTA